MKHHTRHALKHKEETPVDPGVCPEFEGKWGKVGICGRTNELWHSNLTCSPEDQKDFFYFAPPKIGSRKVPGEYWFVEEQPSDIAKRSDTTRCGWVSEYAGARRR